MSTERTRFRCAPLNALERAVYPMRRTGLQSRCAQCGLPRCLSPYLLPLRAPRECQIPTPRSTFFRNARLAHPDIPSFGRANTQRWRSGSWPSAKKWRSIATSAQSSPAEPTSHVAPAHQTAQLRPPLVHSVSQMENVRGLERGRREITSISLPASRIFSRSYYVTRRNSHH